MAGVVAVLLMLGCGNTGTTAADHLLDAVQTGYRANRGALSRGTVRFELVVDDRVRSEDAVFAGDLSRNCVGEGLLALDGQKVRFDCVFPTEVIASHRVKLGDDLWQTSLDTSRRVLTDGKLTLLDLIGVDDTGRTTSHAAQIYPASGRYFDGVLIPLNLGIAEPRAHAIDLFIDEVRKAREGWSLISVQDGERLHGVPVVHLAFKLPREEIQYWIDLDRGGVPLQSLQRAIVKCRGWKILRRRAVS